MTLSAATRLDPYEITSPIGAGGMGEVYYCSPDGKLMAAAVHAEHGFLADAPRPLFATNIRILAGVTRNQYDLTPDGRFIINTSAESQTTPTLVQNWTGKL